MRAILFTPATTMTDSAYTAARGAVKSDLVHCANVESLMAGGFYVARGLTHHVTDYDNEAIFDAINTGQMPRLYHVMNPGDVLIWETGVRYLCLKKGWRSF